MKKFDFRLRAVLRVRRIEEERARAALLAANRDLAVAVAEVDRRKQHYWDAPRPTSAVGVDHYRPSWFELETAAQGVQWSIERRIAFEAVATTERERWAAAKQRVQALERFEAREREIWMTEQRREEDRIVDDLVVARANRTEPPSKRNPSSERTPA